MKSSLYTACVWRLGVKRKGVVASPQNKKDFRDRSSYLEKDHEDTNMNCTHEDKEQAFFHIGFKSIYHIYLQYNKMLVPGLVTASTGSVGSDDFPTPALF